MTEPRVAHLAGQLGNADVRWDGSFYGLVPTLVSDAARQLLAAGAVAIPHLVDALEDESRFVAAHVLLTMLSGVEYPTSPWNGLEIEPPAQEAEEAEEAEKNVRIDPRQRFELARRWRAWQGSTPRPRSLFPESQ